MSETNIPIRDMLMSLLGRVDRHGVYMAIRCVFGRLETGDI